MKTRQEMISKIKTTLEELEAEPETELRKELKESLKEIIKQKEELLSRRLIAITILCSKEELPDKIKELSDKGFEVAPDYPVWEWTSKEHNLPRQELLVSYAHPAYIAIYILRSIPAVIPHNPWHHQRLPLWP